MQDPADDDDRVPPRESNPPVTLSRRALLANGASLGLAAATGCASRGTPWTVQPVPTERGVVSLLVSDYPPLATAGGMVAVQPPGLRKPVLVMRVENDQFKVMSLRCPHLGCTVRWDGTSQSLLCPCHRSRFDDSGNRIEGPAKTGLSRYEASFSEMTVRFRVADA